MSEPIPEELIRTAWERARPSLEQRVRRLQEFAASPSPAGFEVAQSEAHRLAGSLGSYGLGEGSVRAREIESLLAADPLDIAALTAAVSNLAAIVAAGIH